MDDTALGEWLRLRERADAAARHEPLARLVAGRLPQHGPVRIVDLGSGAGSNVRYLVPRLPFRQRWLVVDRSAALLSRGQERTAEWAAAQGFEVRIDPRGINLHAAHIECRIEPRAADLCEVPADLVAGQHLVTASALLDLVSAAWLATLADRCRAERASVLFTLSYDGRFSCAPAEPEDEYVRELFNTHQRRDKGLGGVAEGPDGADVAARCFRDAGYSVETAASDWSLAAGDADMQRVLVDGWAEAACEVAQDGRAIIADWHSRRRAHIDAGRSLIVVGHRDLAAWME